MCCLGSMMSHAFRTQQCLDNWIRMKLYAHGAKVSKVMNILIWEAGTSIVVSDNKQ